MSVSGSLSNYLEDNNMQYSNYYWFPTVSFFLNPVSFSFYLVLFHFIIVVLFIIYSLALLSLKYILKNK